MFSFTEAGKQTLNDFLNNENIKPILAKLAKISEDDKSTLPDLLATLTKELVGEETIERVQQLLSNLQQINQSSLGDILIKFTTAQKELEELKAIEKKDDGKRTEEEKKKFEGKDQRLKEIKDELKKLLEEKVSSTQNKNHLDVHVGGEISRTQSLPNLFTNASLSNKQEVSPTKDNTLNTYASTASVASTSTQYQSVHSRRSGVSGATSTNTIERRIEIDPEPLGEEAQKLIEELQQKLHGLPSGHEELEKYLATGIKQLTDYETQHSKLAELREQLYGTLKQIQETAANLTEQGKTTLEKVGNACDVISKDVSEIKEDLAHTTEALRKDIAYITQAVEKAVSSFTGNPTSLERSIGYLDKLIQYLENEQQQSEIAKLGIQNLTSEEDEFNKWFDGALQENGFKKSDEEKTFEFHEKIQIITLIIKRQGEHLQRNHPDQSQKIESAYQTCRTHLNPSKDSSKNLVTLSELKKAQSLLLTLKVEYFDHLNNLVKQSNTTCIAVQQASQSTQAAAEKFTAGGSRFTYFLLLSTGYISAIVASILLYHKSESVLYKMSFNNPFTIIISSCFLVSTIALFLVARSDTKITDDQQNKSKIMNNEFIKTCLGVVPLAFITLSTIFFAARFLPNFIPPCGLKVGNWPTETILIAIPVGILFMLFLAAIGVFLFYKVKKSLSDGQVVKATNPSDDQGNQPPKANLDSSIVLNRWGRREEEERAPNNSPLILKINQRNDFK